MGCDDVGGNGDSTTLTKRLRNATSAPLPVPGCNSVTRAVHLSMFPIDPRGR